MGKISRCPESPVRQTNDLSQTGQAEDKQDGESSKSPADTEIDSGDDLFITQKPVPEAVRSRRRRSYLKSLRDREEDKDDSSSSSSHSEPKTNKVVKSRKKPSLPKFSFPFLPKRRSRKTHFTYRHNASLCNFTMGGFFKCVKELWSNIDDVPSPLCTVDMNGEYISPLEEEEEEEEGSESEDLKVVEKKRFLVEPKAKGFLQKSKSSVKEQRGKTSSDKQGMSHGIPRKTTRKIQTEESTLRHMALSLDTGSSDDRGPFHGVQTESRTSDTSIQAPTEPQHKKRCLTRGNKKSERQQREEEFSYNSDATVCDLLELQKSSTNHTLRSREVSLKDTESQTDDVHMDDLSQTGQAEDQPESQSLLPSLPHVMSIINNDIVYNETEVEGNKSKKDHELVQSRQELEDLHTARSVNVEADDTPSMSQENPLEAEISDEIEINKENKREKSMSQSDDDTVRHMSDSPHKEKKRKKKKPAEDHVGQEEAGNLESDVREESQETNGGKEKKKKKKKKEKRRYTEDDNGVEQRQSTTVSEHLNDPADAPRKKKKREKEKIVNVQEDKEEEQLSMMELENTDSSQKIIEAVCEKKRKKHKKKRQTPPDDAQVGEENGEGLSHDATSEEGKAKEKKGESQIGKVNAENTLETQEGPDIGDDELVSKKKKKCEKSCENIPEDTVSQSDNSVSARKKKKKRTSSFLDADVEEKDAHPPREQVSPSSKSVAAHVVYGVEKPTVSTDAAETESAEIAGSSGEPRDVIVRKKKKKRKLLQKDPEQDLEEKTDTCQSGTTNQLMMNSHTPEPATDGERNKRKEKKKMKSTDYDLLTLETSLCEASASEGITKVKHKKAKRRLHNPNEDFLKDD